jgi:hypothetical protein
VTYDQLLDVVRDIELGFNCELILGTDLGGRNYLQVRCWRPDTLTGVSSWGTGGKAYLSPHMVKSEITQIAFGLYKGYLEHEARESFKYRGRRVYGPHIDVEALWEVCRRVDVRPQPSPQPVGTGHGVEP